MASFLQSMICMILKAGLLLKVEEPCGLLTTINYFAALIIGHLILDGLIILPQYWNVIVTKFWGIYDMAEMSPL